MGWVGGTHESTDAAASSRCALHCRDWSRAKSGLHSTRVTHSSSPSVRGLIQEAASQHMSSSLLTRGSVRTDSYHIRQVLPLSRDAERRQAVQRAGSRAHARAPAPPRRPAMPVKRSAHGTLTAHSIAGAASLPSVSGHVHRCVPDCPRAHPTSALEDALLDDALRDDAYD